MGDHIVIGVGVVRAASVAVHAFGHRHVGLAGGARTGRLAAQLLSARAPEFRLDVFDSHDPFRSVEH